MFKYLFVGAREDLADFFIRAQDEGFIEFILPKSSKSSKELPAPMKKLMQAIKILRKQPVKEPYTKKEGPHYAHETAARIIELSEEIDKLEEEKRFTQSEIARVAPFGSFSFEDIAFIEKNGDKKIQFYCVKTTKSHEVDKEAPLLFINTEYDLDYYIGINDKPTAYPGMIEMQVTRTARQLRHHLDFLNDTIHQMEAELKGYAGHIDLIRDALLGDLDVHSLDKTQKGVSYPIEGSIFSIEGWVPKNKVERLPNLVDGKALFFEPIAVEKEDKVPTQMKNERTARLGEDLVKVYDIPAASDKDPSGWIVWFFALFFAMILADGGYGMLYLLLAFFLRKKFPSVKGGVKRFFKLFTIIATTCIIWGVLTASFFGIVFKPDSPISRYSVLTRLAEKKADYHWTRQDAVHDQWVREFPQLRSATDAQELFTLATVEKEGKTSYTMLDTFTDNILLEFSLLVGVIHICISLFRYLRRNWANLGWIAFAIGGFLYFPVTLKATSLLEFMGWIHKDTAGAIGIQLLYGGIGFAVLAALIQHKLKGIGEITKVISIFADILSYLRLYALALASTILARTFNDIGMSVGLVIGSVIILAGHSINILLGTMGGVIHGLRLNFIEWYHYCFEGEGRLFNPLRKLRNTQE